MSCAVQFGVLRLTNMGRKMQRLTFVVLSFLVLDVVAVGLSIPMQEVAWVPLNVGVDNGDQLSAHGSEILNHFCWMGKLDGVPSEISAKEN